MTSDNQEVIIAPFEFELTRVRLCLLIGRFFSVRISEVQKRSILEVLAAVGAKKIVDETGIYVIYMVTEERNCDQIERNLRMMVGSENYRRFSKLPGGFLLHHAIDITL